jgi:Response regulator containing a CheY-like receiver domain and an HTH DNA-binding domain
LKNSGKLRILLVDDHTLVREGLKALLCAEPDMEVIAQAADGKSALESVKAHGPDVVVMDVSLPGEPSASVTARILQVCDACQVVVVSMYGDRAHAQQALDAGAGGVVLMRSASQELIRAIRTVAAGGLYLDPALPPSALDLTRHRRPEGGAAVRNSLSAREAAVLCQVAQGYSNKEIAARLALSVKTVETYKARSMDKLHLDSRVDIVRYAVSVGWLQDA